MRPQLIVTFLNGETGIFTIGEEFVTWRYDSEGIVLRRGNHTRLQILAGSIKYFEVVT